jgi:hypothetical protein
MARRKKKEKDKLFSGFESSVFWDYKSKSRSSNAIICFPKWFAIVPSLL